MKKYVVGFFAILFLFLVFNLSAQEETFVLNRLSPDLPAGSQVPDLFRIDPTGQYVAFRIENNANLSQLWISRLDGSEPAILVSEDPNIGSNGANFSFSWSPDGSLLAFVADSKIDEVFELFVTTVEGETRNLTPGLVAGQEVEADDPVFFTADDRIVFKADLSTSLDVFELFSVSVEGGPITKLNTGVTENLEATILGLNPDGSIVVFESDDLGPIYAVATDGNNPMPIRIHPNNSREILDEAIFFNGLAYIFNNDIVRASIDAADMSTILFDASVLGSFFITDRRSGMIQFNDRIVFRVQENSSNPRAFSLYSILADANSTNQIVNLFDGDGADDNVEGFFVIEDGMQVIFYTADFKRFFKVPADGSTTAELILELTGDEEIALQGASPEAALLPGGQEFYFQVTSPSGEKIVLASVADGSSRTFEIPMASPGTNIEAFTDEVMVLRSSAQTQLFLLNFRTGEVETLPTGEIITGDIEFDVRISEDGRFVLYRADTVVEEQEELFSIDLDPNAGEDAEEIPSLPWGATILLAGLVILLSIRFLNIL